MKYMTGVLNGNEVSEQFWWETDINTLYVGYEEAEKEWLEKRIKDLIAGGVDQEDAELEAQKDFYSEEPLPLDFFEDQLIGAWEWDEKRKEYVITKNGDFAAIYNSNSNIIQVVWSKFACYSAPCSPCYPMQGDLSCKGNLLTYSLPPYCMDEEWLRKREKDVVYTEEVRSCS